MPALFSSDRGAGDVTPFEVVFRRDVAFGRLVAVALPAGTDPVPADVLARLHPEEAVAAAEHRARRQIEWVGGRLAARAALEGAHAASPVMSGPGGMPVGPTTASISIAHKPDRVVALVGAASAGTVGVDLEVLERPRPAIASHVLTDAERTRLGRLAPSEQWVALLSSFAVKEAVYKAIYPHVRRYVAFTEAEVELGPPLRVALRLVEEAPMFTIDAALEMGSDDLLAFVRCRRP